MTDEHEIQFNYNNKPVTAIYTQFAKSGRLAVYSGTAPGTLLVDLEGIGYKPSYFTDTGLEAFARECIADNERCLAEEAAYA
jgi:hypothetical protein